MAFLLLVNFITWLNNKSSGLSSENEEESVWFLKMEFQVFKMRTRKDVKIIEKLLSRVSDSLRLPDVFRDFL